MSEAPTTVIENVPTEAPPAANTAEARTPEGQLKGVVSTTPPTPTATTAETPAKAETTAEAKTPAAQDGKTLLTEKPKEVPLTGAPEKYSDFTPPDGYELRAEDMDGARTLFKELNLSQAGAQRLVDFHTAQLKTVMEAPAKQWAETQANWLAQVKSDPEIGGKLDQVKATVARVIDSLGDKRASGFRQAMEVTGAGNHPEVVYAIFKLAQRLSEGTAVPGGGPSEVKAPGQPPRSAANVLYPNLK